jgi:hypothetical protein
VLLCSSSFMVMVMVTADRWRRSKSLLAEIEKSRAICQCYGSKQLRFKTTLPTGEELAFGSEISIDLMFIGGKAVCT